MSLDFGLVCKCCGHTVYEGNITHNLVQMAIEVGIYEALWRPEELKAKKAKDIISLLSEGLKKLKENPKKFEKYNPINGWGSYDVLIIFVEGAYNACEEYPECKIEVSR